MQSHSRKGADLLEIYTPITSHRDTLPQNAYKNLSLGTDYNDSFHVTTVEDYFMMDRNGVIHILTGTAKHNRENIGVPGRIYMTRVYKSPMRQSEVTLNNTGVSNSQNVFVDGNTIRVSIEEEELGAPDSVLYIREFDVTLSANLHALSQTPHPTSESRIGRLLETYGFDRDTLESVLNLSVRYVDNTLSAEPIYMCLNNSIHKLQPIVNPLMSSGIHITGLTPLDNNGLARDRSQVTYSVEQALSGEADIPFFRTHVEAGKFIRTLPQELHRVESELADTKEELRRTRAQLESAERRFKEEAEAQANKAKAEQERQFEKHRIDMEKLERERESNRQRSRTEAMKIVTATLAAVTALIGAAMGLFKKYQEA